MKNHYEMRFGGTGGQGMMLMGDVIARAAGIKEGKEILLTKSYGPESRGGACRSEIIISVDKISYPVVSRPDFVLAMSQQSYEAYTHDIADGGIVLIDSDLVSGGDLPKGTVYGIPLTRLAVDTVGKEIAANVVALGAVAAISDELEKSDVLEAVLERFPDKIRDNNEKAFAAGVGAAEALLRVKGKK